MRKKDSKVCPVTSNLWLKLSREMKVSWVIPRDFFPLFLRQISSRQGKEAQSYMGFHALDCVLGCLVGEEQKEFEVYDGIWALRRYGTNSV